MLEWTKEKGNGTHCETLLGKEPRMCFPNWHDSHVKLHELDKLGTSCHILARLGWPNRAWMRDEESIIVPTCAEVCRW